MGLFDWDERMALGIQRIDDQHRQLVHMVGTLADAMAQMRGPEVLGQILDDLIDYTATHFVIEERLMDEYGYPEASAHKQKHAALKAQVIALRAKAETGAAGAPIDTLHFLRDWLLQHIQRDDRAFGAFLKDKDVR